MKKALITGITGQDGSYLAELLLDKGYHVHGLKRRSSSFNTLRVDHLYQDPHDPDIKFKLHYGDLSDATSIMRVIQEVQPDEIYNLGAMSHVKVSFENPEYTANIDGIGILRILESVRLLGLSTKCKIYHASTSELYGKVRETPQKETTPFYPRSPYAVAKLYAHWITVNYREAYNLFACNGILFNHESPRRGETFVTRKVSMAVAKIGLGIQDCVYLGNLNAKRDWGHAKDYVRAMWLMLQQEVPQDYVIATGQTTSVRELLEMAFSQIGIQIQWKGKEENEIGIVANSSNPEFLPPVGQVVVRIDQNYYRPTEVDELLGNASKAEKNLGWSPQYNVRDLIAEMVEFDLAFIQKNNVLIYKS